MSVWPYPAPVDRGAARHIVPGLAMPDIALDATTGGNVSLFRLSGRAIVFVYPWTGRPGLANPPDWDLIPGAHGSTPEVEGFRDLYPNFQALGVAVYGLSGQDRAHHGELAARLRLPFALLSDPERRVADALALPQFETGGVQYLERLTLLVRDGRLERAWYPVHPPDSHAREILAMLNEHIQDGRMA